MTGTVGLTSGEPAGIGPELALALWRDHRRELPAFFVLGGAEHFERLADALSWEVPIARIGEPEDAPDVAAEALPVIDIALSRPATFGEPDAANAPAVIETIRRGAEFALQGRIQALVTNPIAKRSLTEAGFAHPGHTEYLGELAGGATSVMMLACGLLRVVPITIHIPLAEVAKRLNRAKIVAAGKIAAAALKRDFAISRPRLAVAGLNPHAGEGGTIGREDEEIVRPAVAELRAAGIEARGPLSADSLFHEEARRTYDAALCMYHDQALIAIKTLDFYGGVNVTLGLPFIRTSPDHGTAFDIAGQGRARIDSLLAAMRMADTMAERRAAASVA